jgi:hypothetical protein
MNLVGGERTNGALAAPRPRATAAPRHPHARPAPTHATPRRPPTRPAPTHRPVAHAAPRRPPAHAALTDHPPAHAAPPRRLLPPHRAEHAW